MKRSKLKQLGISTLGLLLLVILLMLLLGTFPAWPYTAGFGYGPSSFIGLLVIVLIVALILGKI